VIQITPHLRILVAVEAVDGRKGIDSLAQVCREKLASDPFSGCLFIFRNRSARAIRILAYDGQGFWLATKRLSKGRFRWWPNGHGSEPQLARASGPDAAGGWQSGNRSRARMAACERMKNLRHHGLAFQFPFCHTYDRWQRWSGNTGAVSSRRKISNLSGS
jgi:transposase